MKTETESMELIDLFCLADKPSDRPALIAEEGLESVSYGELIRMTVEFQQICRDTGVVFCLCENTPGAVAGYLGLLANRQVPLLLDCKIGTEQFQQYYDRYQPVYLWMPSGWHESHQISGLTLLASYYGYELWKTRWEPYGLHEDLCLLLATSGSTGDAKLVRLSKKNILANAASIVEYLHIDEQERPITSLPMNYTYGLSVIHSHLLAGACILMTRSSYVQKGFWEFARAQCATSFSGVPYTYEILKKIHFFREGETCVRTMTQAGGRLSARLQEEVAAWASERGIDFYVMYGQTEATARMGYLPPQDAGLKIGSMGQAIPGGRFYLLDEKGQEIFDADQIGELIYEGANVSMGYASCKEDLAAGDENHGVLHTGDLAKRDDDGYYYIVGRMKRFVKVYGVRVSLDACEAFLRERYPEQELVCAGTDDALCIYLVHASDTVGAQKAEKMAEELAAYLHLNWKGFSGRCVPSIPKNSAGKILYRELQ